MQIKFLGGAREVGRLGISVKSAKSQVIIDYGVMLDNTPGFPMHVPPKEVDALILTHSHLDHSGALPIFYINDKIPLITNKLNLELSQLLIQDFIHLSSYYLPFEYLELKTMMRNNLHLDFNESTTVGDMKVTLVNAGHTPGSASVLIEADGKRFLYTGDFNIEESQLLAGATMDYGDLDAVVIESTYADSDHTVRKELERQFVESCNAVVEVGGTVLVPAFGVGRSQEIACVLAANHFEYPMVLDGMAREASRVIMNYKEFLKDPKLFMKAMHSCDWVDGWRDRRKALKTPSVIISTAGMLKGGPAAFYLSKLGKKAINAVYLVSYQIPGTPGRELMEKGVCTLDGTVRKIKSAYRHFDFSSHCGASQLKEALTKLGGKPKVFMVHGAEGNCELFADWAHNELGLDAIAPRTGETYEI
ncbi:MAG TPA: MBL fold metallo-hydrolase [Candidatus Acidoferrales bacterium]|nr:MBL fold metallo-hydrolase [Candidatus Acidoferrales bacterium]